MAVQQSNLRRRLAPNIVCLFSDDRPPIVNQRLRGRRPRRISSISAQPKIRPGAFCYIRPEGRNHMKVVVVVRKLSSDGGSVNLWHVRGCFEKIWVSDPKAPVGRSLEWDATIKAGELSRCQAPIGWKPTDS